MNKTKILIAVSLLVAIPSWFAYAANSVITIYGTGTPSTSAHITVTTNAYLCPDEFIVESGASLTTWDPSAICGATTSGDGDISLPVELSTFAAIAGDCKVTLNWVTESEVNNLGFIILRSVEKEGDYQEISSHQYNRDLMGAGNSSNRHEYSYTDRNLINGVTYYYKLVDVDFNGVRTEHGPVFATPHSSELTSEELENLPTEFSLYQNYPNPFNPNTTISFDLAQSEGEIGESMYTELRVFDVLGTEVRVLVSENLGSGKFLIQWDGRDKFGEMVASGVYIYLLKTSNYIETRKMLFVR